MGVVFCASSRHSLPVNRQPVRSKEIRVLGVVQTLQRNTVGPQIAKRA